MRYNNAAPGGSQPPFTTVRCERGETKLRTRAGTRGRVAAVTLWS
jgi:hypothetical protein